MTDADLTPSEGQAAQNPRPSRRRGTGLVVVVLGVLALIALTWFLTHRGAGGPGGAAGAHSGPIATVGVATAAAGDIPITIEALGTVTPIAVATVQPQVSGVISQVLFKEGQIVTKGQTLVTLDPRPFQLALEQAQGALQRDEAQLQVAQLTLQRYRTLLAQDSIAHQDVDTQAALVKQLAGTVATDKGAVDAAKLNFEFSRVPAPITGRAGLRAVDVGNYVTPALSTGLVVITQVAPIDAQFAVPQDDLPRIQARMAQGAAAPVTALDRTRTINLGQGNFLTLDNLIDTTTGTVKAKARFANADGKLFPNQFVNVRMLLDTVKGAVIVPAAAVRTGPKGDFVYVVTSDHKAALRPVKRGPTDGDKVSIVQGLALGENVVISGGDQLTDGAAVRLPGDHPAAGPGGGAAGHKGGHRRPAAQ